MSTPISGHRTVQLFAVGVGAGAAVAVTLQSVILLVLVAALVGILILARPDSAALVAVALVFSNAPVVAIHHHHAPGALAVLVPLLLVVTVGYRIFVRREAVLVPRSAAWLVFFLVAQLVGALASRDPAVSVATFQTFLLEGFAFFVLLVNAIRGWGLVRQAAIVLVLVAGLLGGLSVAQEALGANSRDFGGFSTMSNAVINRDGPKGTRRHAGPIGEQNRWAQSLAIILPLAVALGVADRSRLVRLAARTGGVGILAGIVMTYSRGAVVGLILALLIAVLLRWVRLAVALAAVVVAAALLVTFAPVFADRATTVVSSRSSIGRSSPTAAGQDGSFENRSTEAEAAIAVFVRHPAIGVGTGLFPTYYQDQARAQGADRIVGVNREAHSLYLGLAAETGLAGLVAFGAVVGAILLPLARLRRRHLANRPDVAALSTAFAVGLITYLTTGIFLHFAYIRYFWLFAALAAAAGMVKDQPGPHEAPVSPINPERLRLPS